MFNKLKQLRRIATRYDKTAVSFLGFLALAAAKIRTSIMRIIVFFTFTVQMGDLSNAFVASARGADLAIG
jgi:hypothetical protein